MEVLWGLVVSGVLKIESSVDLPLSVRLGSEVERLEFLGESESPVELSEVDLFHLFAVEPSGVGTFLTLGMAGVVGVMISSFCPSLSWMDLVGATPPMTWA